MNFFSIEIFLDHSAVASDKVSMSPTTSDMTASLSNTSDATPAFGAEVRAPLEEALGLELRDPLALAQAPVLAPVGGILVRAGRLLDLDLIEVEIEFELLGPLPDLVFVAQQDRARDALLGEDRDALQDLVEVALGEHDALGHVARAAD